MKDWNAYATSPADTLTILTNVIWLIEQLDGKGLAEIGDLPILELAKHISITFRKAA